MKSNSNGKSRNGKNRRRRRLQCPGCGGRLDVTSTKTDAGGLVTRYRACKRCGAKFKSTERVFCTVVPTSGKHPEKHA